MILPFYKLLLRLKKYIDIDEIRGEVLFIDSIRLRIKHETLITVI